VHRRAFEALTAEGLNAYVSVKPAALGFDRALFGELAATAATAGRRLHLDALGPETADAAWALLASAPDPGVLGVTLPARWRRSAADAERAVALGLAVRVVKGQWNDDGASVDATDGFLAVVDRLRGSTAGVAVATHDPALLAASLQRLARTPCEAELFNGLPFRAPAAVARGLGVRVRVYVAYGDAAAPYDVADVLRRPAAAWWLTQDLLLGKDKSWRDMRSS
jgi:proline dehydrogenase